MAPTWPSTPTRQPRQAAISKRAASAISTQGTLPRYRSDRSASVWETRKVSEPSPTSVPAGWYPDPSGAPQWRVWNGREWSQITKGYGTAPARAAIITPVPSPDILFVVRLLSRIGVPAFFAGYALVLGTLAHWADATTRWSVAATTMGAGLMLIGYALAMVGVRSFQGHWSIDAFVPGLNILSINVLCAQRLGVRRIGSTPLFEGLVLVVVAAAYRNPVVVFLLLASVARTYLIRLQMLHAALAEERS